MNFHDTNCTCRLEETETQTLVTGICQFTTTFREFKIQWGPSVLGRVGNSAGATEKENNRPYLEIKIHK